MQYGSGPEILFPFFMVLGTHACFFFFFFFSLQKSSGQHQTPKLMFMQHVTVAKYSCQLLQGI